MRTVPSAIRGFLGVLAGVAAAAALFLPRAAHAEGAPDDPTKDWPVHFDPEPVRASSSPSPSLSDDALWERRVHRHRVEGTLGFAGTYGAAVAAGACFTGLVIEHERKNPGSDSRTYLELVAVPLFTPVVGPIFLGGLVAIEYTAILFATSDTYLPLGLAFAPMAYGFSTLAIADGIMQGVFLKQAFGWSDPSPPSSSATRAPASVGRTLLGAVTPMVVPEVRAPAWISVAGARGLPSGVGLQLPVTW